eukprot:gene1581-2836_t
MVGLEDLKFYHANAHLVTGCVDKGTQQICITPERLQDVRQDKWAILIGHVIATRGLPWPSKKHFLGAPRDLFAALVRASLPVTHGAYELGDAFRPKSAGFPTGYAEGHAYFQHSPEDYETMDCVTDVFNELPRVRSSVADAAPAVEYWTQPHRSQRWLNKLVSASFKDGKPCACIDTKALREFLWQEVQEPTQFKPSLAKAMYTLLGARKVLDFSAGWGDRLVGALAAESVTSYVGVDPNWDVFPGYANIMSTLGPQSPGAGTGCKMICAPFEHARLPPEIVFDTVFTSPPFYIFETYGDAPPGGSPLGFQSAAWGTKGGHIAIHLCDITTRTGAYNVLEPMMLYIQAYLPGSLYKGCISSMGVGLQAKPRPMWIFEKQDPSGGESNRNQCTLTPQACEEQLQQHYPEVMRHLQLLETVKEASGYLEQCVVTAAPALPILPFPPRTSLLPSGMQGQIEDQCDLNSMLQDHRMLEVRPDHLQSWLQSVQQLPCAAGHDVLELMAQCLSKCVGSLQLPFPYKASFLGSPEPMYAKLVQYQHLPSIECWALPYAKIVTKDRHLLWRLFPDGYVPDGATRTRLGLTSSVTATSRHHVLVREHGTDCYESIDVLPDMVNEHPRVCSIGFQSTHSPMQHWITPALNKALFHKLLGVLLPDHCTGASGDQGRQRVNMVDKSRGIDNCNIREILYSSVAEARQAKCTVYASLFELLRPYRVLDCASAYGDRMIAALSRPFVQYYCGVDPNPDLTPGYMALLQLCAGGPQTAGGPSGALPQEDLPHMQ